mmetsp:Transcript_30624/g.69037  ORF Transcript_30624/g.69037 Transcript_30624/m.69037 type:complete len:219 (-) Transcript_30624:118-774(-)
MCPESWLLSRLSTSSWSHSPICGGIGPLNEFPCREMCCSLRHLWKSTGGSLSRKRLPDRSRSTRSTHCAISTGMTPCSAFLARSSEHSREQRPMDGGRSPTSLLRDRSMSWMSPKARRSFALDAAWAASIGIIVRCTFFHRAPLAGPRFDAPKLLKGKVLYSTSPSVGVARPLSGVAAASAAASSAAASAAEATWLRSSTSEPTRPLFERSMVRSWVN